MKKQSYRSMPPENAVGRRDFLKAGGAIGAGLVLTGRSLLAAQQTQGQQPPAKPAGPPPKPKTNIEDALKVPRTKWSLPGPFPGRVVEVHDPAAMPDGKVD
ncbi:MAG: twin-arginine translocation signal domain-containing protein, partial [Candidatus Aminicenantes bacterium]|nr:twin-arginine translocation signal domain-containing protein [Candidatus Aminicenantes bacterium]